MGSSTYEVHSFQARSSYVLVPIAISLGITAPEYRRHVDNRFLLLDGERLDELCDSKENDPQAQNDHSDLESPERIVVIYAPN